MFESNPLDTRLHNNSNNTLFQERVYTNIGNEGFKDINKFNSSLK